MNLDSIEGRAKIYYYLTGKILKDKFVPLDKTTWNEHCYRKDFDILVSTRDATIAVCNKTFYFHINGLEFYCIRFVDYEKCL